MRSRIRSAVGLLALVVGGTSAVVGLAVWLTWPDNTVGDYVHIWRAQREVIRAVRMRAAAETDSTRKAFYTAWLAEEEGDIVGAIRGFGALRDQSGPETKLYLASTLRLGQAYGRNNEPNRELAVYRGLLPDHPGASRMSQAAFHLRRGEEEPARRLLEEALAQDARDGSLGGHRDMARAMLAGIARRTMPGGGGRG